MKRALHATLLLSLAANALFLVRAARPTSSPSAAPSPISPDTHPAHAKPQTAPVFSASNWSALQDASPTALTILRQLGLTDPEIRAIVRAEVDARYAPRERALRKSPAYWERTFSSQFAAHLEKITDPAAERALALQKENELRQLLGDIYEPAHAQLRQFTSYLPFEKAWHLKLIYDDYRLLEFESKGRGTPLRLPTPREQASYLQQQQRADIVALLTPDELRAHDLRSSSAASFLRRLAGFDLTEQEFLALYEIRKSAQADNAAASRENTQKLIDQQTRAYLGEKRFADYQRAQDPDFRASHELATNLGLPPETAIASHEYVKSLRAKISAFAAQNNMTPEQENAFYAQLRQEMETTLTKLYGEKAISAARDLVENRLSQRVHVLDP